MPFVPISDEELKSLNSLESKRFVPISNEELKALNSSLQLASQQPAKGVTRTTTKVSATSTGKLPVAEPYQVPLPDAMVSVSKGRNVASQLPMSPDEFVNAPDFSEKSIYSSGIKDATYQQINAYHGNDPEKKAAFNLQLLNSPAQNFSNKGYAYITEDELKTYNYIHSQLGEKAANSYLDSLGLTSRMTEDNARRNEELAKKHPIITSALSPVLTFAKSAAAVDNAVSYLGGNGIDENSFANQGSRAQSSVRGTVSNSIEENIGGIGGKIGSFAYQTGMSIADYLTVLAGSGGNKTAVLSFLSTSAATDALIEGKNKGLSDGQAMLKGVVAGAAEAVFEKIPLDNLFSIGNKSGVTKKVLEVLKQMGLEGAEEVGTDVANAIADGVISGNKSDYNLSVRAYMESGLSEAEARNKAAADFAKQIGMSFAGGAISGGVLGTGAELLNSAGSKKANASTSDQWTNGTYADTMEKTQAGGGTDGRAGATENLGESSGVLWEPGQGATGAGFGTSETDTGFYERISKNAEGAEAENASGGRARRTLQVGDRTYDYEVVPSAEQSAQAKQTQTLLTEYGIPSEIVYWSQSNANGITQTMQGEASTLRNGTVLIKNDAVLQAQEMAGHEMAHVAAKKSPAEYQKYYDAVVNEIDFSSETFVDISESIIKEYFIERGKEFDFTRDYPTLYKELVAYISGDILADEAFARQEYSSALYNFDAVLEAWKHMDTAMREYGKSTKKPPKADSGNTGSAFFDADSKGSTDNIDAIVRDVFGYGKAETQGEVRKPDLSQEAKSSRAAKAREIGSMFNINPNDVETVAILAEQTGRNIEFVETLGEGINGKYDAETGTLYIAADSPNPVKTIIKHELTHSLEGTQAYTELSKFVSDILVKETGMSLDEIIEAKIGIYGLSGETLDSNGALAELVADYVGDNLFTSEKAIRQLSAEKPSLARRILNWIRSMKTKLFGTNHEKLMAEAERMYHDALMEPFVKGSDSSYAKYSIQHDADGKRYVHVDTDQEIFNGKSVKEMRETARKYILDAFRGKVLPVGDGDKAFVNGRSASEYANPANRHMPDELKSAKMRASTELDNLLAVSDKIGNVPDDGRHPEATGGWDVYRTNFEVGGEMFSGEVKIKVTDKGRLFYDVTKIERTARNRDQTRFNPAAASGSSSDTTIPQTHDGVNTSISENSAYDTGRYALKTRVENSDGVELTDGQERYFEKSQVRDDEGRLLVVYHATDADFTVFDKAKQGSANDPGVWGSGFYFDTDQSFAEEFGSKSKPYYLNITNPLRTTYDADCHVVAGIFRRAGIDIPFKIKPDTSLLQFIKKFGNRKFSDTLQALGYDGVIVSGEECVIFEPEQAKLTNNINPSGDPDIRHSIGVSSGDTIADIKAMVERYGAIKRGEAPARDVEIPKQTNDQTRTRQYVRTAAEASQVPDSFINGITQDVMNDVYAYVPISNNEAMERAVSTVENMGLDKAIEQWNAAVNGEHMPSKYDVALGEYLLTLAGKNNDPALASKMIIELSTVATNAGQAVQAMSMLKRMTPEGQLMALQKVADRINRERPDSNVKIPETIIDRVQRVNPRDTEAVDQIMHDGLVALAGQVPSTWLDKWNAWRYLAMLGNPRTHIRNIVGNAAFTPIIYTKDFLAGAIEGVVNAASKAAGGQGIARTKTALSALPFSKRSEYLNFVREDFQKMKDVINGGGGKNPADVVRDNQKVFTSKLMQPVEKAGKLNSKLLEAEDLAFKKIHYERALMQYLAANKIDLSTVTEETLNRGRNYAIREAQKATFADASAFASALNRLSRQHKAAQFLIEGNLPFKKTPVNILKRGVEYSPAGVLDTVTRKAYQLKTGKIGAAEFIDSLSAGLTGTGIMALGMWLASAGLLSGGLGGDKDDQFSKLQGEQEYALKIGDTSYTIDWAAPAALPLFVGAEIVDLYRDSKTGEVPLSKLLESLTNLSEPMVNMSMLQGINDAIENVKFSDNPIVDFGMNAGVSYLSQGVPTLLGQIARTSDDTRRRNYVEQGSAFPTIQMALQRNKSKIPGALQTQQPYVDAWGREEPTGNIAERAFSNFLSPGYTSEKQMSSMEKELERLYEETGDAGVLPSSAQKSITNQGEKYVLTAEEYTEYQRTMGKTSYELLSKLTGSSEYKKLTDEQRTDAVSEVYSYAKDLAKEEMLKSRGVKYEASSKRQSMDAAKKNGVPLSMYLLYSIQAKDLKSDKKSNGDTVSGSLKRKKEELLNNMGVTAQQKRVLLLLDGYGSKQQREQLLTGTVSSGSSYEETAIDRLLKGALS
jgi:hypothetical protein